MNSTLSKVVIFAVGAALGSAVTWKLVKTKYERIANEEIAEMREYVRKKQEVKDEAKPIENVVCDNPIVDISEVDKSEYVRLAQGYLNGIQEIIGKGGEEQMKDDDGDRPYVITPEDFAENDDYDIVSLVCYADKVVEDDQGKIVQDINELFDEEFLDRFGEFDDDSVYVRNDELKIDYEILLDVRTYADANSVNSHKDEE